MGWTFIDGASRRDIINELISSADNTRNHRQTLAHCTRGNVLWTVTEVTSKPQGTRWRFIGCALLERDRDGWGYKDMCESMGPCYYTCPLSYLQMVPQVTDAKWRERVRETAQRKRRTFNPGDRVALDGASVPWVVIRSKRPLIGEYQGKRYRVPRRYLGERLERHVPEVRHDL